MSLPAPTLPSLEDFEVHTVSSGPRSSLLDAVDRVIDKGAVIGGDLVISIADVDLVSLNLNLLLAAMETLDKAQERRGQRKKRAPENAEHAEYAEHAEETAAVPPRASAVSVSSASSACSAFSGGSPSREAPVITVTPAPDAPTAPAAAGETQPRKRIELDPKDTSKGVAKLVLTLVEFIRQLLERQAIRRMEGGRIPDAAVERMGAALAALEARVLEMKDAFGLAGEDLDLDLGPLGRLNGPGQDDDNPRSDRAG